MSRYSHVTVTFVPPRLAREGAHREMEEFRTATPDWAGSVRTAHPGLTSRPSGPKCIGQSHSREARVDRCDSAAKEWEDVEMHDLNLRSRSSGAQATTGRAV